AAGIAHVVGNPLGAIGTYVEVLRRRGADPEVISGVTRELDRLDRIVRGLLDYARPREETLAPLDAGAVARGAYGLLEAQGALKVVQSSLDIAVDVPRVLGRAHLLEQAIVNLVLNAVDAAPGGLVILGARAWASRSSRAPCTTWAAACGWTPHGRAGRRSRCSFQRHDPRACRRRRARAAPIPRPAARRRGLRRRGRGQRDPCPRAGAGGGVR